jgi:hypothetical protein
MNTLVYVREPVGVVAQIIPELPAVDTPETRRRSPLHDHPETRRARR